MQYNEFLRTKQTAPHVAGIDYSGEFNGRMFDYQRDVLDFLLRAGRGGPLQLDLIERALIMWSAPGDTVYSPFTGIGSEGYMSIKLGRKFIGTELKPSYFRQAVGYLQSAESQPADLFAGGAS